MFDRMAQVLEHSNSVLPADVVEAIEAAHIIPRDYGDDGLRVFVVLGGGGLRGSFEFENEEATKRVFKRWPDLSEKQVSRAVSFLGSRVAKTTRAANRGDIKRKNWVQNY
jgi:hypothetical protein